ncbi:MerR family transcriptional regulator [Geodermatophilus nigrescens]|uniref:DNA-binding transcriptional regulator, MerR family n=1 Tax=Geodermatophilus nigrescens TaxID=1070870 RepID=A0A1M5F2C8_9ACTN|nr:MerR family transcriptional regulator [Geodermatophilus nigrescens]SHF85538.1 DNA-binding transcriptional regulator, MerR family [Geodermatophilus nigrescens]
MEAQEQTPGADDGDREFTVDELAARVGITVRNVRAYAARGLLPPPRLVGRTGYYGPEHVARLLLVREMLAEGYSLAVIERTLATAPAIGGSASLALHRALLAPWLPPEPEDTTAGELTARAGVPIDPATVEELVRLGLVERLDGDRLRVTDPSLLTAGLQVMQLGVPPSALITAQARVIELVREIAATYVGMFLETGWRSLVESASPPEQLDRVGDVMSRLQPAAAQALLASFRTEMAAAVSAAVEAELRALAGD